MLNLPSFDSPSWHFSCLSPHHSNCRLDRATHVFGCSLLFGYIGDTFHRCFLLSHPFLSFAVDPTSPSRMCCPLISSSTHPQVGQLGAIYVFGCVVGSLFFGYIGDRFGRRKLFLITPSVYLTFTVLTSFATGQAWFAVCRFFCGLGVGGEYAAINSTIDEFIPARVRGTVGERCKRSV